MPARGFSVTPKRKRREPTVRQQPSLDQRRGQSAKRAAPARGERERLRAQVGRERQRVQRGTGARADTRDVTRGTRVMPGERERARRFEEAAGRRALDELTREIAGRGDRRSADWLKRELEGTGQLTRGSEALGRRVVKSPSGLGISVRAAGLIPGVGKLIERGVKDIINLPAVALPSAYVPSAAIVEALKGRPQRAQQFAKDFKETDPIYAALTGDLRRAGRLASEHPGFTALEVAGVRGAVGRGAGRAVRGTGKVMKAAGSKTGNAQLVAQGERVRRVAAVETRPDAVVPGTGLRERREYSRDLARKGGQVLRDRDRLRRAERMREEARRTQDPDRRVALRKKANELDPTIMSDKQLKARENLREARDHNRRVVEVANVDTLAQRIIKEAGDKGAGPVLVASGVTRASVRDLAKYRDELKVAHGKLEDPGKRDANERLRRDIDVSIAAARKGNDPGMRRVLASAKRYSEEIDKPLDSVLSEMGLLARERGERAKLIPTASRERGAVVDPDAGVTIGGRRVGTDELKAIARAEREIDPVYVSQGPNARGPGAYYRASAREPTVGSRARTERPTREGTFDANPEMLRARAMNAQGLASAARSFRETIAETGVRDKNGKVRMDLTSERADKAKRALEAETGLEFEKVAVRPWAARREQVEAMQDALDAGGELDPRAFAAFRDGLVEAFEGKGNGPFALVPRASAQQQVQHLKVLGPTDADRFLRSARSAFTRTVLTTSPGPTFGNLVEPAVRSAAMRAGPVSTVRGLGTMRQLRKLDPAAALKLEATLGRGMVTLASRKRYVDPQQFSAGTVRKTVAGWQAFKRAKGVDKAVAAWDMWTHLVFEVVNGRAEAFYRQGPMLGKVLRDSGLMDHTLLGLSKKARLEAAKGLTDTPTQALLAKKLNDAYGKYGGFSPGGRKVIAEYTPFAAWFLSSMTFLGKVLPRDHPALTGLIAAAANATEEWRRAQGLDLFMGEGKLPGWLQGTVPAGKHGRAKLAYNTPAGAATSPGESLSSLFFPQGMTLIKALSGFDWKDKKLRNDDGSEYDEIQKALYAAGELLKSSVPIVAVPVKAKRYVDKPGTLLNPVLIPPRKGEGGGSSGPVTAEQRALQREAEAILKEQAGSAEQKALEREARAILAEQQGLRP